MDKFSENESKSKLKLKLLAEKIGMSIKEVEEKKYSKKQLKRLLKNQVYNETKLYKRRIQKEKKKLKKKDLIEKNLLLPKKEKAIVSLKDSSNKVKVAIDLSFNSLMNEKEFRKLMKQIQRSYSLNRRSKEPLQFYLTSLKGPILDGLISKQPGFANWDIFKKEDHYIDVFKENKKQGTLIFLSSDSPNVLPESDMIKKRGEEFVYIIGGLVDHNVHKGFTLKLAEKNSIKHARLPIDSCIEMSTSKVLAVNHVFEIMLLASTGTSWTDAFLQVIPHRKLKKEELESDDFN